MFIGGVFVFGDGQTKAGAIINLIFGLLNLGGGIAIAVFGFANNSAIDFFFGWLSADTEDVEGLKSAFDMAEIPLIS